MAKMSPKHITARTFRRVRAHRIVHTAIHEYAKDSHAANDTRSDQRRRQGLHESEVDRNLLAEVILYLV